MRPRQKVTPPTTSVITHGEMLCCPTVPDREYGGRVKHITASNSPGTGNPKRLVQ